MYTIDKSKKPQKISIFLANPNRVVLGKINMAYGVTHTIKLGQVNELSLSIPYEISKNSQLIRNPIVDLVREKYLIKVVFGSEVEWYRIVKKVKTMNDTDSISLECYSLAYDLKFQLMIDYQVDSYNCLQALTDCLENTNWTVGYINDEFNTTWRSFDVSSSTKLDFISEICDTFKGTAYFDTVNRTVGIYKDDELSTYKGFWIDYGKYLSAIEDTVSVDDIVTRLVVTANDTASIESANPTGKDYIDDFSYFLYPFERDENKNVISSSYFMDDDLCHAILDYNELINQYQNTFASYLATRKSLQEQMTTLQTDLQTLKDDLQLILDDLAAYKSAGLDYSTYVVNRDKKQTEINNKQSSIDAKQVDIDGNQSNIDALNDLLKFENNFGDDLFDKLKDFIQVEEWSDDNQIDDESYFYAASDYLSTVSIPPVNLTLNIINFFEIVEEQYNWDRLNIGDIIRVRHPKLGIDVKTTISQITFNYDDGTIDVTVSNTKRPTTIQKRFENAFYKIKKLETDVNKRKKNWEAVATNFVTSNDRIKVKPTNPKLNKMTHKQNDDGSVNLNIYWNYNDSTKTKLDADNVDGFMVFLYSSSSNESYVFGSNSSEEQTIAVSYDKRAYTFNSLPANLYYYIAIKAYRNVDNDIDKTGVLFSDIVQFPVYQPSPKVVINADVTGKVNGVNITVSAQAPQYPEPNDVWTNTATGTTNIFDGSTWLPTSAGNANSLNGLTSDSFALSSQLGDLSTLTTTNKSNLVGAINEIDASISNIPTVENNLTSTSTTNALSAYQGKILNDQIKIVDYLSSVTMMNGSTIADTETNQVYKVGREVIINLAITKTGGVSTDKVCSLPTDLQLTKTMYFQGVIRNSSGYYACRLGLAPNGEITVYLLGSTVTSFDYVYVNITYIV